LSPKAAKLSTNNCLFSFSFHLSFFFCIESENNIQSIRESCANTIQELNQELFDIKTQCQEYEKINKQVIIENESLDDRSIVVGHQSTIDKYTQYKPLEQNHIAIETNSLIYQNNQTQIDPIHTIDQQSQTELLWSIVSYQNSPDQTIFSLFFCSLIMKIF
jgi:hypothetical protein